MTGAQRFAAEMPDVRAISVDHQKSRPVLSLPNPTKEARIDPIWKIFPRRLRTRSMRSKEIALICGRLCSTAGFDENGPNRLLDQRCSAQAQLNSKNRESIRSMGALEKDSRFCFNRIVANAQTISSTLATQTVLRMERGMRKI